MKGQFHLKFNADTIKRFHDDLLKILPDARISWRRNNDPATSLKDSGQANAAIIKVESGIFLEYFRNRGTINMGVIPENKHQAILQLIKKHRLYTEPSTGRLSFATIVFLVILAFVLDNIDNSYGYYDDYTSTLKIIMFTLSIIALVLIWGGRLIMINAARLNQKPGKKFRLGSFMSAIGIIITLPTSVLLATVFRHPNQAALATAINESDQAKQAG